MNNLWYSIYRRIVFVILINLFTFGCNSTDIRLEEIPQSQEQILNVEEFKEAVIISQYVGDVGQDEKSNRDFEMKITNTTLSQYLNNKILIELKDLLKRDLNIKKITIKIGKFRFKRYLKPSLLSFILQNTYELPDHEIETEIMYRERKHNFSYLKKEPVKVYRSLNPFTFGMISGAMIGTPSGNLTAGLLTVSGTSTEAYFFISQNHRFIENYLDQYILFLKESLLNLKS